MGKKYYEITKHYRNNADVYYIASEKEPDEFVLQSIGENTEGGESYGYRMEWKEIPKLPKGAKLLPRKRTIDVY